MFPIASVLWMFNASLGVDFGVEGGTLRNRLSDAGIESRKAFVPINEQKPFLEMGYVEEDECPVANDIMETGFYLPSGLDLTDDQIDDVCETLKSASSNQSL